jgi:hypothetical protein
LKPDLDQAADALRQIQAVSGRAHNRPEKTGSQQWFTSNKTKFLEGILYRVAKK